MILRRRVLHHGDVVEPDGAGRVAQQEVDVHVADRFLGTDDQFAQWPRVSGDIRLLGEK